MDESWARAMQLPVEPASSAAAAQPIQQLRVSRPGSFSLLSAYSLQLSTFFLRSAASSAETEWRRRHQG